MTFNELWTYGILGRSGNSVALLVLCWILCIGISYLLGSLNFGLIISKYKFHDDIRKYGSGNAGMTNMLRTYGKAAAGMTLLGDSLKAAVSILIVGHFLCGTFGAYAAGLACIVGHVFPVFFGFKGGKGVVTTAVMVLCLNPLVFLILLIVFVGLVATTKYLSLGSVMCMLIYPYTLYKVDMLLKIPGGPDVLIAIVIAAFVIWLHRSNIKRLINGTENKFSLKSKKKDDKAPAETDSDQENGENQKK